MKTVWRFLNKLKIELPYDPGIPLLGMYTKEMKSLSGRDICTPMFTAALLTIAKIWKEPKCPPMGEWINKVWYMCNMAYYSAIKEGNPAICDNMDGP